MRRDRARPFHRGPGLALRPTGPAPGLAAQRLRRWLGRAVRRRRRPAGVPGVRLHLGGDVRDLRLQLRQGLAQRRVLGGLLRDPRVPLRQQPPHPRDRCHSCREHRASQARTNAATTAPRPHIGKHRNGHNRRESAGDERESQTDLSRYAGDRQSRQSGPSAAAARQGKCQLPGARVSGRLRTLTA
jgi:hypothetical protein